MTKKEELLSLDLVRLMFGYDASTGLLTRTLRRGGRGCCGNIAGWISKQNGYRIVDINQKNFMVHRLIWFYVYGVWPKKGFEVDHKNRIRDDNRIENLRLVDRTSNNYNRTPGKSISGLVGVRFIEGSWQARIAFKGKQFHLGCFESKEKAHAAYIIARENFFIKISA